MQINKDELLLAQAFIDQHFDRVIDWAVGDIRRCCRMKPDGTCDNDGALVGAFILWCCAIEYFGGLFTGLTTVGGTKVRYKDFISKYMPQYDPQKVEDLRWSLSHYYSPHHFVLYHEGDMQSNRQSHLTSTPKGILLHLGCAIFDLENAVKKYHNDVKATDNLKIKIWRFYKEQLPIMPIKVEKLISPSVFSSLATGTAVNFLNNSISASGTVDQNEW